MKPRTVREGKKEARKRLAQSVLLQRQGQGRGENSRREAGGDHRDESLDTGRALGGSSNRKQVQDRRLIGSGVGR